MAGGRGCGKSGTEAKQKDKVTDKRTSNTNMTTDLRPAAWREGALVSATPLLGSRLLQHVPPFSVCVFRLPA